MLAVCSTRRQEPCPQARLFAARARSLGRRVSVLEKDLSHREINQTLGEAGAYTDAVEAFLASLSPGLASRLQSPSSSGRRN